MSAPAALAASKLLYPETKKSKLNFESIGALPRGQEVNILDAASQGVSSVVLLVANIGASLIAVIAFIAFINGLLGWFCGLIGFHGVTIEYLLGLIFIPLAWLMGVENADLIPVGELLGLKSFVNEFVAYSRLNTIEDSISDRSKVTLRLIILERLCQIFFEIFQTIATFALCGFSNPASIGIQIASFSTLAPSRRGDFSKCAIRAYISGSLACFMTACIAGTLYVEETK